MTLLVISQHNHGSLSPFERDGIIYTAMVYVYNKQYTAAVLKNWINLQIEYN